MTAPLPVLGEKHVEELEDFVADADFFGDPIERVELFRDIEAHVRAIVAGEVVVVKRSEVIKKFGASLCEGCEGNGDLRCHGVEGLCGMCDGTGRIEDELSRWLTPQTQEKGNG